MNLNKSSNLKRGKKLNSKATSPRRRAKKNKKPSTSTSSTKKPSVPSYRKQKSRSKKQPDRAFVELSGQRIYLGEYDSPESKEAYHRLIAEWIANGMQAQVDPEEITISELCARFLKHAMEYYRRPDGSTTTEVTNYKLLIKMLRKFYGSTLVDDFGPRALKALREEMIQKDWTRTSVNKQTGRIKALFRWGVEQEFVNPSVFHGLQAVAGLRRGRSNAKESKRVKPAPKAHIDTIKDHVSRQVWAIIQLQLFTGARSGELVIMRPCDIDMSGKIWTYKPSTHKTEYHGHERNIYLGPQAQTIIRPFLAGREIKGFLFSPKEAEEERREKVHSQRKTPLHHGNSPGTNIKDDPKKQVGERYTTESYCRAIRRACKKAEVPHWHPHQLRHNAATNLRKEFGLDVARIILGHRSPAITEVYAELDREKALRVMEEFG